MGLNNGRSELAATAAQVLLFSKGQVYVHPSQDARDNLAGYLSIIEEVRSCPAGCRQWPQPP